MTDSLVRHFVWDDMPREQLNPLLTRTLITGEKGMLAEGGIRVPYVVYWKGQIKGGETFHHPVISLDVAATTA